MKKCEIPLLDDGGEQDLLDKKLINDLRVERDLLRCKLLNLEVEKKTLDSENTALLLKIKESSGDEESGNPCLHEERGSFSVGCRTAPDGCVIPDFISFGDVAHVFHDPLDKSKFVTVKTEELPMYLDKLSTECLSKSEFNEEGFNFETALNAALEMIREVVDQHKEVTAGRREVEKKLQGAKAKTAALYEGKLKGAERMLRMGLKQREDECKDKLLQMQRKHEVSVRKLESRISYLKAKQETGEDYVVLRNGFLSKERAYQKEICDLKEKVDALQKELKDCRQLVADNCAASMKQRKELKEAKALLVEFEDTKNRLVAAELSIHQNSEVRDIRARCDEQLRSMQRIAKFDKERADRTLLELARVREELGRAKRSEENARTMFRLLQIEFKERVGEESVGLDGMDEDDGHCS